MKILGTKYSHVSFLIWDDLGKKIATFECVLSGGVVVTGEKWWDQKHKVIFQHDFTIDEEKMQQFIYAAFDSCGEPYSLLQNIGIEVSKFFNLKRNIFSNGRKASNCSELVERFGKFVGLEIDVNPDMVTPKDVVHALKKLGK
jgi:uncharacterized protein YycO